MKKQVVNFLDSLIIKKRLEKKNIYVFGANASGSIMINYLIEREYKVKGVLDNNRNVQGKYYLEIKVSDPEKAMVPFDSNAIILIASRYYEEMKKQLQRLGYIENKHIYKVIELNPYSNFNLSIETFNKYKNIVLEGYDLFNLLKEKYNTDLIIMSPVKPNGDIYILCSYLLHYIKREHNNKNYIFTVVGKSCEKTAKLFNIKNVQIISSDENTKLVALANLLNENIKILNPYYNYQEAYYKLDGYNQLTFVDEIKHGLMNLPLDIKPFYPKNQRNSEYVKTFIKKYNLIKGKSVIIAPYANSIPLIIDTFWEELVGKLKEMNYKVYTNCGTDSEMPIKGSERIYFSFEDAVAISEYAGTVISYRSGFCEIIARSKCKKIIIYPDHIRGHSTLREFFCMEDSIYEQENLYEITNTFDHYKELLFEVLKYLE